MVSKAEFKEYYSILEVLAPRRLVISGGNTVHRNLAVHYKSVRPEAQIEVLWHGSPLQWTSSHERALFEMWLDQYDAGTVTKFWVLKRGLEDLLERQGINAELIQNYLPQKVREPRRLRAGEPIRVGIWSATNEFKKNLLTQFLAFAGDTRFRVYHTVNDPSLNSMFDRWRVPHIKVGDGVIPRSRLLSWMAWMDINLYVSLSECSPMIPLESIAVGVPVVVGPTTSFFEDDPFLQKQLVVPSPDQLSSIRQIVEQTCKNYDAVTDAIVRLGLKREAQYLETRGRLKLGLAVVSRDKRAWLPKAPNDERGTTSSSVN